MPEIPKYAAGADIGGSHIHTCVVNLVTGAIVENSRSRVDTDSHASASRIIDSWTECLGTSLEMAGVPVVGAGFAFPGPFDYDKGISLIKGVDKFEHIFGLDIAPSLNARLGHSLSFRWVNDASAFALGERLGGAARGLSRAVCLTLGSGVGSAFLDNGAIVTEGTGIPANGWVYCLPFEGTIVDDCFSTRWFLRRWKELTGLTANGVAQIAAVAGTDPAAAAIFGEYGRRLAQFAGEICAGFECTDIVLGGNITRAWKFFGPEMCRELENRGLAASVHISRLRDEAAMVGAASLFC